MDHCGNFQIRWDSTLTLDYLIWFSSNRTFDIQCSTESQCNLLFEAFKAACPVGDRCSNQPTISDDTDWRIFIKWILLVMHHHIQYITRLNCCTVWMASYMLLHLFNRVLTMIILLNYRWLIIHSVEDCMIRLCCWMK